MSSSTDVVEGQSQAASASSSASSPSSSSPSAAAAQKEEASVASPLSASSSSSSLSSLSEGEKKEAKEKKEKEKDIKVSNVPAVLSGASPSRPAERQEEGQQGAKPVPFAERPRLEGEEEVSIPHLFDPREPPISRRVSRFARSFQMRPGFTRDKEGRELVYWNYADSEWYQQLLPSPLFTVWILIKNTSFELDTVAHVGYVKRRLVEEAVAQNVQILLRDPNKFDMAVSRKGLGSIVYDGQLVPLPQIVVPRVGANVDYLGLAVLRQLEALGVKVFNPVSSIEISRDKLFTHQVLSSNGVPIPKTLLSRAPFDVDYIEQYFGYPVVVKLASGSRGEAVWKLDNRKSLSALVKTLDKSKPIIVQEYISSTRGRDLRCLVIGNKVVASCMRLSEEGGFKANFHAGGSVKPVEAGPALSGLVLQAAQLCGLDIAGVDVLMDSNTYRICELNSSPGFEGLEKATGVNCGRAMIDYLREYVEQQRKAGLSLGSTLLVEPKQFPLQEDHLECIREAREQEKKEQEEEKQQQDQKEQEVKQEV